jgi:hypothetical protein
VALELDRGIEGIDVEVRDHSPDFAHLTIVPVGADSRAGWARSQHRSVTCVS